MFPKLQLIRPIRVAIKSHNRYQEKYVISSEMRKAMQEGIQQNLCPRNEYKKPLLKLDKESKSKISEIKKKISQYKQKVSQIERQKEQLGTTQNEIKNFDNEVENALYEIFKLQTQIRNVKIQQYKKQLSSLNLDKTI